MTAGAGRRRRTGLAFGLAAVALLFAALGAWQVERRAWKLDLIARVEARIRADPAPLPPAAAVTDDPAAAEYRRVTAAGRFLPVRPAFVQALTVKGAGFWVLAPFRTAGGATLLVNRGFVSADGRAGAETPPPDATATGLLRLPEPGGGFLRANDPAADRWYSRDVPAIAQARGLGPVLPYFVDAEAGPERPGAPVGGLTVVRFRNEHAVYAATWFALAVLAGGFAAAACRGWSSEPAEPAADRPFGVRDRLD